jgi:hypothetical protein
MVCNRSAPTLTATILALALCACTASAYARGGGGHGGSTSAQSATTQMSVSAPKSPPTSGSGQPSGSGSNTSGRSSGGSSTTSVGVSFSGPLPFTPLTPSTGPSDNLPPRQELPDIAPLSPQLPTQFATGGSTVSTLALSPGSSSPSESAPSTPGGGGKRLVDCMGFWESATHMSKREWRASCLRTMDEYPSVVR